MSPEQVAGIGLLGVLFGAIIGWGSARRIDEQRARREAYARYLSEIDEVVGRLIRRWHALRRDATPVEPYPDHERARVAFTALIILASDPIVEIASELQSAGNGLGRLVGLRRIAKASSSEEWDKAADTYSSVRRRFINRARKEVGARPLPDRLFD